MTEIKPPQSIFGPFLAHINVPHIAPIYSTDVCLKWRFCAPSYNPRCLALCRWKVWLLATLKWSDKFTTALPGKSRLIRWPEKALFDWLPAIFSYTPSPLSPIFCTFFFFFLLLQMPEDLLRSPFFFFLNPIERASSSPVSTSSGQPLFKVWWRNLPFVVFPRVIFNHSVIVICRCFHEMVQS